MSKLQHTVDKYRAQLLAHEQQAEATIDNAYRTALASIQPILDKLYKKIAEKIEHGEEIPPAWLAEQMRLESIQSLIQHHIDQFGGTALTQTVVQQHLGVQLGMQSAQDLLNATVPRGIAWSFGMPSMKAIASLVGATQRGSPLADLFAGFGAEAAQNVAGVLQRGVVLGQNPRTIAGDVANALGISRARALTISRSEMMRAYRSAAIETYQANDDVVEGMVRVADLSARTCAACIALNGTVYKLGDDPGFHPNDRCTLIPKTKPWADILGPLGIDTSGIEDTSSSVQSGSDWFDQQDEATQRAILGNAKFAAFQHGAFTLNDVVGHDHDPDWGHGIYEKSLKQLVGAP